MHRGQKPFSCSQPHCTEAAESSARGGWAVVRAGAPPASCSSRASPAAPRRGPPTILQPTALEPLNAPLQNSAQPGKHPLNPTEHQGPRIPSRVHSSPGPPPASPKATPGRQGALHVVGQHRGAPAAEGKLFPSSFGSILWSRAPAAAPAPGNSCLCSPACAKAHADAPSLMVM